MMAKENDLRPSNLRILCLDVGDRRVGVAVSDPLGITAQPLDTYTRVGYGPDVRHIAALAAHYATDRVLCGLPRNMDGSEGGQADKVRAFAAELEKAGLRVSYWDERLTTASAERALIAGGMRRDARKQKVDMVAAAVILQAFLDAENTKQSEESAMDEQQNGLVELVDEEGSPAQFRHLMTLEHEGESYVLLCDAEEEEGDDEDEEIESEVYILRIDRDESGEDCYVTVEDEALLDEVFDKFIELAGQEEDGDEG